VLAIACNHRSWWKLFIIKHCVLPIVLTPGNRLIYPHIFHDVVDFDNKQVEVDSFDEHPTESCQQKVLQKGSHGNTGILHNRMTNKSGNTKTKLKTILNKYLFSPCFLLHQFRQGR